MGDTAMIVRVVREPTAYGRTLGQLRIDGAPVCFTLEDTVREVPGQPVESWKIHGQTAIPEGRYRLALSFSPKFGMILPEVWHVPGFTGIRIHAGNTEADTDGCILVGLTRERGGIGHSRDALAKVLDLLLAAADEPIWLDVGHSPAPPADGGPPPTTAS